MIDKKLNLGYNYDSLKGIYVKTPTKSELGKKIRCFIYARVSSQRQVDEGNGIDNQVSVCKTYAKHMGYEVIEVFSDLAVSGRLSHRAGFDGMMESLKKLNKYETFIDYVLMSEYSRFSRNQKLGVTEDMEDEIKNTGCHLRFERGDLSTDNKKDEYSLDMEKIKSKYESVENSDRTKSRMKGRMQDGYAVLAAPPGYSYEKVFIGKKSKSFIKTNREQFEIIQEGLKGYANGIYTNHTALLNFFNSRLLRANSSKTRPGHLLLTFIQRMLQVDRLYFYAGYLIYPKFGIYEPIDAEHEVMISLSVMHKIRFKEDNKSNMNSYGPKQDTSEAYPLRGLIYCESCHRPMTSIPGSGNGGKYYYYGCNRKDCPKNYSIPVANVHEDFLSLLHTMKAKPEVLLLLESIFKETLSGKEQSHKNKSKAIKEQIADIDKRIEQKLSLIDKLTRVELIVKVEDEIGQLMQHKSDLENRANDKFIDEQETTRLFNRYKSIIENPVAIWDLGNKDLKRMLLLVLFDGKLYYNKKDGYKTILNEHIYAGLNNFFDLKVLCGGTDETRTRDLSSDSAAF